MNRRTFVATMAAATLLSTRRGWASNQVIQRVGLQLYTVRRSLQQDFDGTLAKVAAIGYREVEFAGYFGRSPKDVKASLDRVGLVSPSSHVDYNTLDDKWPSMLEAATILGQQYIVCPSVDEKLRQQLSGWQRAVATFNRAGETARQAGIQFAYHNHSFEFEPVEGRLPYDILLQETDPQLVKMEMDIFWLVKGGADPLAYFHRFPGRFPLVHVKGRDKNGEMTAVAADNSIDWKKVFTRSEEAGIQHYFVEHDNPTDEFASIRASFDYLHRLQF